MVFVLIVVAIVAVLGYCLFVYRRDAKTIEKGELDLCKLMKNPSSYKSEEDYANIADFIIYLGLKESKYEDTLGVGFFSEYKDYLDTKKIRFKFEYQTIRLAYFLFLLLPNLKLTDEVFNKLLNKIYTTMTTNMPKEDGEILKANVKEYIKAFTPKDMDEYKIAAAALCLRLEVKPEGPMGQKIVNIICPNLVDCVKKEVIDILKA